MSAGCGGTASALQTLTQSHDNESVLVLSPSIVQIENLRHREVKGCARGHPARKWQSWDSDARGQGPETPLIAGL